MAWTGSAPNQSTQRTDGVRIGAAVNVTARNAGVNDTAELADARENDLSGMINLCLKKDGGNTATGDIPMGNHKLTGMALGTARDDSIRLDQLQDGDHVIATVGGTANAITLTTTPTCVPVTGMVIRFIATADNTNTTTVDLNGDGAKALQVGGTACAGGEVNNGQFHEIGYDGTQWQLLNPYFSNAALTVGTLTVNTNANPDANDGAGLGTSALGWSDLFLASGGVINWNNGDVTITHAANTLTFGGASSGYAFTGGPVVPATNDAAALGTTALGWSDLFLASGGVLDFGNGLATISVSEVVPGVLTAISLGGSNPGTSLYLTAGAVNASVIVADDVVPTNDDGGALGDTGQAWSDLFLASGAVIDFASADVTITHSANTLAFAGASSGYFFDNVVVDGHTAALSVGGFQGNYQAYSTSNPVITLGGFSNTAAQSGRLNFYRSRGASIGSATVVQSGDLLGALTFYGAQQTGTFATQSTGAQIRAEVDGTVTSGAGGDMPGRIVLSTTPDASGTLTDRLILDSAGVLKPNANDGVALGTGSLSFADLFLASGAVVNFNNGDVTLTHSADTLTLAGGGLVLPAVTTTVAPLTMTTGTVMTTPAAGALEFGNSNLYFSPVASSRHVVDIEQWVRASSVTSLSNSSTSAQNVFAAANDVLTLSTGIYFFEVYIKINTGTTTHTTALGLPVSANLTRIRYMAELWSVTAGTISTTAPSVLTISTDAATVLNATSAAPCTIIRARGQLVMSGAGTVTPQITFSAGPTGTCEIDVDSYMRIWSVERGTNTTVSIGPWA